MKLRKYIWLFLLLPFGCVDDDSSYGGVETDEITIGGIGDYFEIEIGERLQISPEVTSRFGEDSDLSYLWYKYNREQVAADTLSREKDLDVAITDVLPGVETALVFKVTDNTTGIFYMQRTSFKTLGKYAGGTLMLCRNGGEYDLSMVKRDGTTLYEDIYSLANGGEKLGKDSRRILLTKNVPFNPLAHKAVIVTCDDRTGGVYLNPDILTRQCEMRDKFTFSEDLPEKLVITGISNSQTEEKLVVSGEVYGRAFGGAEVADWNPKVVFLTAPYTYEASEFVLQPSSDPFYGSAIFYDNLNGRFMANVNGGYFSSLSGEMDNYLAFDPSDLGAGVKMAVCGYRGANLNLGWSIMKDETRNEYQLLNYQIVSDIYAWPPVWGFEASSRKTISAADCPGLYSATLFRPGNRAEISVSYPWVLRPRGIANMAFYLSNNRIYAFNSRSGSEGVIIDGDKENFTITGMECSWTAWPLPGNPGNRSTILTLCIQDRSLSGKKGGIAIYRLNSVGGLSAEKLFSKAGFCDEVISTAEKEE